MNNRIISIKGAEVTVAKSEIKQLNEPIAGMGRA